MNILKSRTVLGTLCIAISLIICFCIAPYFNAAAASMVDVVRVKKNISIGEQITADNVEVVKVGNTNLPNVFSRLDLIIGKYAAYELFTGEFLITEKISATQANENVYLYGLTGEKQAISITISSFAGGLSGKLMSGDIVCVIASDYKGTGETVVPDELKYIEVIAVTDRSGYDVNESAYFGNRTDLEPDGSEEKALPSTITVLARPEQAKLLAQLESEGGLHVSLVFRGSTDKCKTFIDAQDEILKKLITDDIPNLVVVENNVDSEDMREKY